MENDVSGIQTATQGASVQFPQALPPWASMPTIRDFMAAVAATEQQFLQDKDHPTADRIGRFVLEVLVLPPTLLLYSSAALHVFFGIDKEALAPFVLGLSAWIAAGFWSAVFWAVWNLLLLYRKNRKLNLTAIQAGVIDGFRSQDESTLRRLEPVSLLELEEAKVDVAAQATRATTKATLSGTGVAVATGALKLAAEAWGVSSGSLPAVMIAGFFLGVGAGGAIYYATKSKFDRAANILEKAILRKKDKPPKDALAL